MKNARLLFALVLVGAAAACSADGPTGSPSDAPRHSAYMGGGAGTPPDSTSPPTDSTKPKV